MPPRVDLMGKPGIRNAGGKPVDLPLGKPLALLGYLVVEARAVGREEIAELLWPDSPRAKARQSARQALWWIRRALGEEALLGTDPVEVSVPSDVQALREALASGAVDEARALWRGPLLAHLTLSRARPWEQWLEDQRHLLARQFFQCLLEAGMALREGARAAEGLVYLREAVGHMPSSLQAWHEYAACLLDLGRLREAADALAELERRGEEDPEARSRAAVLSERLRDLRASGRPSASRDRLGDNLEFVGRSREMELLRSYLRRSAVSGAGVVTVSGPTGIGKTRLCHELLSFADTTGFRVAGARGYESEVSIPFGTVADLVGALLDLPGAAGVTGASDVLLRSMVPSKNGRAPGGDEGVAVQPAALADALTDLVESVAFEAPLVVFVDDLHWVDLESRSALGKVARRLRRTPCLFLFSRSAAQEVEASGGLTDLPDSRTLELAPLNREEVGEMLALLAEFTRPQETGHVVARVHATTGGSPLFVVELLRSFAEAGVCTFQEDRWVLHVESLPDTLELPRGVQELLEERLARVEEPGGKILLALAQEGRSAPSELVRRRAGLEPAPFEARIAELEKAEILGWTREERLDFTHHQLRKAVLERFQAQTPELSSGRRRLLAGAAVTMVALLLFVVRLGTGESAPPTHPFGQGRFLIFHPSADSAMELVAPAREGEDWFLRTSSLWVPRDPDWQNLTPVRLPSGGIRWLGAVQGVEEPPYAVELGPGREPRTLFRTSGDDVVLGASPLGTEILLSSENLETPQDDLYDMDVVLVDEAKAQIRLLYRARDMIRAGEWSADGQRLALTLRGVSDTLLVLTPDGGEVYRRPFPEYRRLAGGSWCGDDRHILLRGENNGGGDLLLVDIETEELREIPLEAIAPLSSHCLAGGRAVAHFTGGQDRPAVVIRDFQRDRVQEVEGVPWATNLRFFWIPDSVSAPVRRIGIQAPASTLAWGERMALTARAPTTGDSLAVRWSSADPAVASVSAGGLVTGNGTGRTRIVAEYRSWLRDSVEVRVADDGRAPEDVLFRETFGGLEGASSPALPAWVVRAENVEPPPTLVAVEDGPALSLNGDGRYRDFIYTREAFSLAQGVTLELEFKLPLTDRRNHQRFQVCLAELEAPDPQGSAPRFPTPNRFCFRYPSAELFKLQRDLARVDAGPENRPREVSAAPALPSPDWVHLALQLRADGAASVFLDREPLEASLGPLTIDPDRPWRIDLSGWSKDTQLLVRNLALWRGERY